MSTHAQKTHTDAKCIINNCFLLFYTLPSCRNKFSVYPVSKRKKSFTLQGDWKCSKLIQQKCSVKVSRSGVSLESLWSCSPVLYHGRVKDTLSSGVAVFTLLSWIVLSVWWTGGDSLSDCVLRVGSRILAFAEGEKHLVQAGQDVVF